MAVTRAQTPARSHRRRVLAALLVGLVLLGVIVVKLTEAPAGDRPAIERFSPEEMASLEQRAWQAYYERRWPTLFQSLFTITRDQFGVPLWRVPYATYLATRAQVVWARQGDADGLAEDYMRRFYAGVKGSSGGGYDPARAAALEVRWWAVHRNRDSYPDNRALADALAELYAEVYQIPADAARPAGQHRAEAMDISDRWVREGKDPNSPLLAEFRAELLASYQSLKAALSSS